MADRTIIGGIDSWVGQVEPSANHNGGRYCLVHQDAGNNAHMLLFIRPPAPVAAGSTVLDAKLKLHLNWSNVGALTFKAIPLASDWKAGKVTWANMPATKPSGAGTAPAVTSITGATKDMIVTFDVAAQLQAVADGAKWFGWRIDLGVDAVTTIFSSEAGTEWRRPRLEVTWSNAPVAPTDLSPSGGRFISVGLPTLRYSFADYGGNRELVAHQIQVDPTEPEGTTWDSGELPTSEPEFELAGSTYPGLANDAAARWRVRVQDGAGLWSGWSDWAHFERLNKGGLVIDSPAAPPDNYVQEVTPPVLWTHSGPWAQEAFQVIVQQEAGIGGDWITVYDSKKKSGNDAAWTLPKGVLTRANWTENPDPEGGDWDVRTHYRLVVRTWDGQGRQHTPGDPVYYQATREFDVREGMTAKVTNLTITLDRPYPWARIEWQRDTAPDKFHIVRGGNVIETVRPEEVSTGGTSYAFTDKTAVPNRRHTWAILPVVNHVMAPVELTWVKETVHSHHLWLTNPDRDNRSAVLLLGGDGSPPEVSMTQEDQGETYEIVGGSKSIRVTNALKGYAGTVSGVLAALPTGRLAGIDGREWGNRLWDFKAEPGARLVLHLSDMAIPVTAFNITVRPTSNPDVREFEFEFLEDRAPRFVDG